MNPRRMSRFCVALVAMALFAFLLPPLIVAAPPLEPTVTPFPTSTVYPTATVYPTPAPRAYLPLLVARSDPGLPSIVFWADRYVIDRGQCVNLHWRVDGIAQVMLDGYSVAWTGYQRVCPAETHAYRLDAQFQSGAQASWTLTITVNYPPVEARFWSEQYALPAGGCATLHWRVTGATAVHLDGMSVPGMGTQQTCPVADMQFYTLEVISVDGSVALYYVVLTSGDPMLQPTEVIAQAIVSDIDAVSDVDPAEPGPQPGYRVALDGVRPLYAANPNWPYSQVTLDVSQVAIDFGPDGPVHWPLHIGQRAEFRAACQEDACVLDYIADHYLYMTSE